MLQSRNVSPVLRGILRHPTLGHDRRRRRHGTGEIRSRGCSAGISSDPSCRERDRICSPNWDAAPAIAIQLAGRGPNLVGVFDKQVLLEDGRTRGSGRKLRARIHRESGLQDRLRIQTDHAYVPGHASSDDQLNALVALREVAEPAAARQACRQRIAAASPQPKTQQVQ